MYIIYMYKFYIASRSVFTAYLYAEQESIPSNFYTSNMNFIAVAWDMLNPDGV